MKYLNKKIIYLIIILIFSVPLFLFIDYLYKQNKGTPKPPEEEPILSNRDIVIKEALENPDKLPTTEINGEIYFLTGYDDTFYGESHKENKPGWKDGGIIILKIENGKPVIFWESEEVINQGKPAHFQDINNDGIDEIVWEYYLGVTGRTNAIYVYKFNGDRFKIITPVKTIELITPSGGILKYNRTLLSGIAELTYIKDIDNDRVQEIMVGSERNINDIDNPRYESYQQIYKYNGEEYYLWKEEKIGEEKS